MASTTIEERLSAVEKAVAHLQQVIGSRTPAVDWLERVTGSMRDEPAFEEVLEYGQAIRQADRPNEGE